MKRFKQSSITILLDAKLKRDFKRYCRKNRESISELLRELIIKKTKVKKVKKFKITAQKLEGEVKI